jgi:hypothetical protein
MYHKGDTIFKDGKWMTFDGEKFVPEAQWIEKRDGGSGTAPTPTPAPAPVAPKPKPKAPEPEPEPTPKPKKAETSKKTSKPPKKRK